MGSDGKGVLLGCALGTDWASVVSDRDDAEGFAGSDGCREGGATALGSSASICRSLASISAILFCILRSRSVQGGRT
jgi:hypothetical protein